MSLEKSKAILFRLLRFAVFPAAILMLVWEPNILNGFVDHLEAGQYLSGVNGIFRGQVPYKDFFLLFGSLQLYLIAGAMVLFGKTLAVMKLYFYATYLLGFLAIYALACAVYRGRILPFIMTLVCVIEVSHPFWATSFDYGRMGLGLIIMACITLFLRTRRYAWIGGAGLVSSFALFYTIDIGIFTGIAAMSAFLIDAVHHDKKNLRSAIVGFARRCLWFAAGYALFAIPYALFLAVRGGLLPFLYTALYIMPKYHMKVWGQPVIPFPWWSLAKPIAWPHLFPSMIFKHYLPGFVYAASALYLGWRGTTRRWDDRMTVLALLVVYGALIFQGSFRAMRYAQFFVTLPVCIIVIGLGIENAVDAIRGSLAAARVKDARRPRRLSAAPASLAAAFILVCLLYGIVSEKWYYKTLGGWAAYEAHKGALSAGYFAPIPLSDLDLVTPSAPRFGAVRIPRWQEDEMGGVTAFIRERTRPDEELLAFPEHGIYAFLADRPSFSRFHIAGFAWTLPAWREELLWELVEKKPRYVVVDPRLSHLAGSVGRKEEVLPEVLAYIQGQYREAARFGKTAIYARKGQ